MQLGGSLLTPKPLYPACSRNPPVLPDMRQNDSEGQFAGCIVPDCTHCDISNGLLLLRHVWRDSYAVSVSAPRELEFSLPGYQQRQSRQIYRLPLLIIHHSNARMP